MSPQARCWSGFVPFTNPAHFTAVSQFQKHHQVIFSIEKPKLHFCERSQCNPHFMCVCAFKTLAKDLGGNFGQILLYYSFFCQNIDVVMIRDQTALKKCKIGIGRLFSAIKVQSLEFAKTFPFRKLFVYKMLNLENKWMVLILTYWYCIFGKSIFVAYNIKLFDDKHQKGKLDEEDLIRCDW